MLHKAKTARLVITLCGHITDKLLTSYRHISSCRPTVSHLSADCRPTVSRLIVYVLGKTCRPFVGQQTADRRPADGRQSANRRPTVGQQTADRFFGELFFTITNTSVFKPHSTEDAATSAAKAANVPIHEIMNTAGWHSDSTFAKFYDRPITNESNFAEALLTSSNQ